MSKYERISAHMAALRIIGAMAEYGGQASTAEMMERTGLSIAHINKGKRLLTSLDDDGVFICVAKGRHTTYKLSSDVAESRLYIIWLNRRSFRYQQSALRATVKSERVAARVGGVGVVSLYAQKASQLDALAGQKATLRQFGSEAGFTAEEIESWFAEEVESWSADLDSLLS